MSGMSSEVNLEMGRILIVDDNPNNLKVLSEALGNTGWEILVATDGEGAIEQAEYSQPDIMLLDVMMPGMDGFETCLHLKANHTTQDIPVIFMTALADTVDKVKGFNVGAVDYITKPFEHEEVLARVKSQLKIRSLARQVQQKNQELERLAQDLEARVVLRTAELSQTLEELKKTQVSLVQREKTSALGELVAGIAHEINNPINAITVNIEHASDYIKNLGDLVQLYQDQYPEPTPKIKDMIGAIELDYVMEDLPKILTCMGDSTDRIIKIVKSVRHFSRRDESVTQAVDIHEGLDSTLLILSHRLKIGRHRPVIEVVKDYGTLPPVVCYPGPLNQVFMNILANAIDALDEAAEKDPNFSQRTPTIRIHTELRAGDQVLVCIADNGLGMTEAVKERLSEPMFTTKPVGKGTGLGLSITRQIIEEKHGGSLWWVSEPNQGAEFWLKIPLQPISRCAT